MFQSVKVAVTSMYWLESFAKVVYPRIPPSRQGRGRCGSAALLVRGFPPLVQLYFDEPLVLQPESFYTIVQSSLLQNIHYILNLSPGPLNKAEIIKNNKR
jgi:hypothetical protein